MDKKEYKIRLEQIKELLNDRDYEGAMEVCNIIDWKRVKNVSTLCTVSEIYKINRKYEDARDILLLAYDKSPDSKSIVYALCELSLKLNDIVQSVNYRNEYEELAPGSSDSLILTYRIFEAQEVSIDERISVLEAYKKAEGCTEKWGYELALLYHRSGQGRRCAEECDELVLTYGDGEYVRMALELKAMHRPLTEEQQELFDRLQAYEEEVYEDKEYGDEEAGQYEDAPYEEMGPKDGAEITASADEEPGAQDGTDIEIRQLNVDKRNSTINIQEELSRNVKEFFESQDAEDMLQLSTADGESVSTGDLGEIEEQSGSSEQEPVAETGSDQVAPQDSLQEDGGSSETETFFENAAYTGEIDSEELARKIGKSSISDTDDIPRIRLLKEEAIRKGGLLSESSKPDGLSRSEIGSREEAVRKSGSRSEFDNKNNTDDMPQVRRLEKAADEAMERARVRSVTMTQLPKVNQVSGYDIDKAPEASHEKPKNDTSMRSSQRVLGAGPAVGVSRVIRPENKMNRMLAQDNDGQISMVMPDPAPVDRQITGQMDISGYLSEWERQRKESQRKRIAAAKRKSLEQTNNIASQLESVLPRITGEIPSVEEMAKEVTLPEEDLEKTKRDMAELKKAYDTGQLPYMSGMEDAPDPEELEDLEISAAPGPDGPAEPLPKRTPVTPPEPAMSAMADNTPELQEDIYPEEPAGSPEPDGPDELYQGNNEEIPQENYYGDLPQDQDIFDTSQIPQDDFSTDQLPYGLNLTEAEEPDGFATDQPAQDDYRGGAQEQDYPEEEYPNDEEYYGEDGQEYADDEVYSDDENYYGEAVSLSDQEYEALFGEVIHVKNMKRHLDEALPACSMIPQYGNVVVYGNEKSSRIDLALGIVKYMKKFDPDFTGRPYKINARDLNSKDIRKMLPDLFGGALVVEDASLINVNTLDTLAKTINHSDVRIIIIFETDKKYLKKLSQLRSYFDTMFDVRIEMSTLSNNDLVEYAKKYARDREYVIDEMGVLALHQRIDELQTATHNVTKAEVDAIMDAAIEDVDKKNFGLVKDILFSRRYDKEDLIILREKNFEKKKK